MKTSCVVGMAGLALVLAATALPVAAEIIIIQTDPMVHYYGAPTMPTLVMTPPYATISPQVSYPLQRARAWSNYRRNDDATGAALVYTPALAPYGGYVSGIGYGGLSHAQAVARAHLMRANAYRLGY